MRRPLGVPPRRFHLPDGRVVDNVGHPYDLNADPADDDLYMEKVSLAMCDDLTVGDAINFFSIQEAPYRPFLTIGRGSLWPVLLSPVKEGLQPDSKVTVQTHLLRNPPLQPAPAA